MNSDQLWQSIIGELELTISKANFTTWFKDTRIIQVSNETITVGVPNSFTESWLKKKYQPQIVKVLRQISHNNYKDIVFKVDSGKPINPINLNISDSRNPVNNANEANKEPEISEIKVNNPIPLTSTYPSSNTINQTWNSQNQPKNIIASNTHTSSSFNLNPKYTFDTFIVGKANELAHAASRAVADKPGSLYNPLFVYGGVGLGKTHLIQAVGNEIATKKPEAKILYITTEKFTNDYIQALQKGQMEKFRQNYRSVDVLLVDDIQFMAGKDQTQEEFFHTFNALYQSNKQIVINSDRPPKAIPSLEQRLVSRFASGMIADISQPDFETRVAILDSKVKEKGLIIPENIIRYLADNIQSNVRELEGALNKIVAIHQLSNSVPDMETAQRIVSSLSASLYQGSLTSKHIINAVSSYFGLTVAELASLSRKKDLVLPRQIAMYIIRQKLGSSFPTIGEELGGRDHTTAMHACNKIAEQLKTDEKLKADIENIINQITQQRGGS